MLDQCIFQLKQTLPKASTPDFSLKLLAIAACLGSDVPWFYGDSGWFRSGTCNTTFRIQHHPNKSCIGLNQMVAPGKTWKDELWLATKWHRYMAWDCWYICYTSTLKDTNCFGIAAQSQDFASEFVWK